MEKTNNEFELPKYQVVENYIKHLIKTERLLYGGPIPSENELIKRLGVSRHTVRKALDNLRAEGFIYKEKGRGTFCGLDKGIIKKEIIAIVCTYISEFVFPSIIFGIEKVLSEAGYMMFLCNTDNSKEKERQVLEYLLTQDVKGIILEPAQSSLKNTNSDIIKELFQKKVKLIYMHACYDSQDSAYVLLDDEKGSYKLTEYLIQLGHRRICGIFKSDDQQGIFRKRGFLKALEDNNLDLLEGFLGEYNTLNMYDFPYIYTQNMLRKSPRPSAFVCYNDQTALTVGRAVKDGGLRIPEDLSLVGFDDSLPREINFLTTLRHPQDKLGIQIARYIIDMLEGNFLKPQMVYEPEMLIRNSCKKI